MTERVAPRPALRRTLLSLIALLALIGLIAAGIWFARTRQPATARTGVFVSLQRTNLTATVNASGQIAPVQTANLSFTTPGIVEAVQVEVGSVVEANQPLATIDGRELRLRLTQAEAALTQAQANAEKVLAGATPEEIASAQAQVRQAQAQYRQTAGSVTQADIAAAQAQLEQAQAQLNALTAGPRTTDVRSAESQLEQSRSQLQAQRDQLSAAKTNAELALTQSTNTLTQAQSRYATAKQNWEYVRDTGNDPINPSLPDSARPGQSRPNTLNDAQRQQYYDAFVQAEAALRTAETNVQQAQVAFDTARQAEVNGIQVAEEQVNAAQTNLDRVTAGADTDQLAAARAQVQQAQANLAKLRGEQRGGALAAAQAGVDAAQANLARVQSGAQTSDLAVAQAQVSSAEAARDLAQLALDQATLTAPFRGTVAAVNLRAGEVPGAVQPAIILADLSSFYVDVAVDEIDVSRVRASQPVTLTLDALPGLALQGEVASVAPLSTEQSAVTSYAVRLRVGADDVRVKPGMSTNADIVVDTKTDALVLPRRAVRNDQGRLVVDVPVNQAYCTADPATLPDDLELEQREVQIGLSNDQLIEITGGLDTQTCVNVEGLDARSSPLFGRPRIR